MSMVLVESSSIDDILRPRGARTSAHDTTCESGEDCDLDPGRDQPRAERRRAGRSPTVDSDEITKNSTDPPHAFGPRDWDPYWRVGP